MTSLFNMIRASVALVINPCVNRTLTIKLNFEKKNYNFNIISSNKNLFKIQYLPHLKSKNDEITPRNLAHERLSSTMKCSPQFPYSI